MTDIDFLVALNGPWNNAACCGYCMEAMRRAGASPELMKAVLRQLEGCFDDYSVDEAENLVRGA